MSIWETGAVLVLFVRTWLRNGGLRAVRSSSKSTDTCPQSHHTNFKVHLTRKGCYAILGDSGRSPLQMEKIFLYATTWTIPWRVLFLVILNLFCEESLPWLPRNFCLTIRLMREQCEDPSCLRMTRLFINLLLCVPSLTAKYSQTTIGRIPWSAFIVNLQTIVSRKTSDYKHVNFINKRLHPENFFKANIYQKQTCHWYQQSTGKQRLVAIKHCKNRKVERRQSSELVNN